MKKNIYIYGMPRTGKTTLATYIAKRYSNYHIINIDAIREAFFDVFPDNINYKEKIGMQNIFPQFLSSYIKNEREWNKETYSYIIEGYDIIPESIKEYFPDYLKYGLFYEDDITTQDVFESVKMYDTNKDWSYSKTDEFMLEFLDRYVKRNEDFQKRAIANGIKCFKTSNNRRKIFDEILEDIRTKGE